MSFLIKLSEKQLFGLLRKMADGGPAAVLPELEALEPEIPEHVKEPPSPTQTAPTAVPAIPALPVPTQEALPPPQPAVAPPPPTSFSKVKELQEKLEAAIEKHTVDEDLDASTENLVKE